MARAWPVFSSLPSPSNANALSAILHAMFSSAYFFVRCAANQPRAGGLPSLTDFWARVIITLAYSGGHPAIFHPKHLPADGMPAGQERLCRGEPERSIPYHLSGGQAWLGNRGRHRPGLAAPPSSHPSTGAAQLIYFFFGFSVKLPDTPCSHDGCLPVFGNDAISHIVLRHGFGWLLRIGGPFDRRLGQAGQGSQRYC
jgi:hypothetical protein